MYTENICIMLPPKIFLQFFITSPFRIRRLAFEGHFRHFVNEAVSCVNKVFIRCVSEEPNLSKLSMTQLEEDGSICDYVQ